MYRLAGRLLRVLLVVLLLGSALAQVLVRVAASQEAAAGAKRHIKVRKRSQCPKCHGAGGTRVETCTTCHGTGHVRQTRRTPFGYVIRLLDENFLEEIVRAAASEPF